MPTLRVPGLLLAAVLMLAACGSEPAPSESSEPAPSAGASEGASTAPSAAAGDCEVVEATDGTPVRIAGFAFEPGSVTVKAGETVTWTNEDTAGHTATLDDGSCGTGTLQKGESGSVRFDAPGEFAYICSIHPQMTGTVVVEP
jgi:plastocyanin